LGLSPPPSFESKPFERRKWLTHSKHPPLLVRFRDHLSERPRFPSGAQVIPNWLWQANVESPSSVGDHHVSIAASVVERELTQWSGVMSTLSEAIFLVPGREMPPGR